MPIADDPSQRPPPTVERAFVPVPSGLVHYRHAGASGVAADGPAALPAYLAHSGPGSSAGLASMVADLARSRRVIAPDMLGNGDSTPPFESVTCVDDYVRCAIEVLDALAIERVDFYGQHSGAHLGCELALQHPDRVRRLVLDGIALFDDDEKAALRERYAPRVEPDESGGHLAWAWHFVEGLYLHFPYYLRDPAHRLHGSAVPPPAARHALVVELLKSLPTYHLAYHAMFGHPTAARLPGVVHETLVMAVDGDPLGRFVEPAAALMRAAVSLRTSPGVSRDCRAAVVSEFLAAPDITFD